MSDDAWRQLIADFVCARIDEEALAVLRKIRPEFACFEFRRA